MKNLIILSVVSAIALSSCSKEETQEMQKEAYKQAMREMEQEKKQAAIDDEIKFKELDAKLRPAIEKCGDEGNRVFRELQGLTSKLERVESNLNKYAHEKEKDLATYSRWEKERIELQKTVKEFTAKEEQLSAQYKSMKEEYKTLTGRKYRWRRH